MALWITNYLHIQLISTKRNEPSLCDDIVVRNNSHDIKTSMLSKCPNFNYYGFDEKKHVYY